MRDEIKQLIKSIYVDHRTDLFNQGCSREIDFIDELIHKIGEMTDKVDRWPRENEPAEEIYISVNTKTIGDIQIKYDSILYICKIAKYYYLQHEVSMDNPDDERIAPDVGVFGNEGFNKKQFSMDEMIVQYLTEKGYERLWYREMEESFHEPVYSNAFKCDEYLTVKTALFMDYIDINKADVSEDSDIPPIRGLWI